MVFPKYSRLFRDTLSLIKFKFGKKNRGATMDNWSRANDAKFSIEQQSFQSEHTNIY